MVAINYTPAGNVTKAFHASDKFVRAIKGPIGSGKSVACCIELVRQALQQKPGPDGISRQRAVIIRNTLPELKSTTLKTWLEWFDEDTFGKVRYDSPITQVMTLSPTHRLEVIFLALDRPEDTKKLLSLETTWVWLNECRELPKAVLDAATGRVGRYPSKKAGGPSRFGVIMDTNPPDTDHWFYKLAEEVRPENMEFFHQPSGTSVGAENLGNLPPNYYSNLIPGKDPEWVKVFVSGEYGSIADGRPVFPEYNDNIHAAKDTLSANSSLPLYLSFDFGLTPAAAVWQLSLRGQFRVLDELIGEDIGLAQFVDTQVKPLLAMKYSGFKIISLHDPAGVQRSQADETTCRQILRSKGLNPSAVGTNLFTPRRESVAYFLTRLIDGEPAFLLSPNCPRLRKALNGDYKYKRINVPGEDRYKDVPDKNMSSHIAEALGYGTIHVYNPARADNNRKPIPNARNYQPALTSGY